MLIQCTKSLLDKIGVRESELASPKGHEQLPESLLAWHANFITINRRKAIVLMNNEARYPVVIYRPSKKDFSNIRTLITEAITEALRMEGIRESVIKAYLTDAGEISFSKTANPSMVAKLNNTVRDVEFREEYLAEDTIIQSYISLVAGRKIQRFEGKNNFEYPIVKLLEYLKSAYGSDENTELDTLMDVELYQLHIQINIEGHNIWRRVLVPSTFSFRHLHNIIQTVFDWQNYHLHEFIVERTGNKPINIIMDDHPETLEFAELTDFEIEQERFVSLKEIFSNTSKVNYEYDFGDSWEHIITLEKIVKSNEYQAVFLDGNGKRPPEDVGGVFGYEEYLAIIENENDPEHQEMKEWAENQQERELSPEQINKRLKRVFLGYYYSPYIL